MSRIVSFSAVTRVDSSHRRGHLIYRKACLACLQFEKELRRKLTFEEFVAEWKDENIVLLWYHKKHFCLCDCALKVRVYYAETSLYEGVI